MKKKLTTQDKANRHYALVQIQMTADAISKCADSAFQDFISGKEADISPIVIEALYRDLGYRIRDLKMFLKRKANMA